LRLASSFDIIAACCTEVSAAIRRAFPTGRQPAVRRECRAGGRPLRQGSTGSRPGRREGPPARSWWSHPDDRIVTARNRGHLPPRITIPITRQPRTAVDPLRRSERQSACCPTWRGPQVPAPRSHCVGRRAEVLHSPVMQHWLEDLQWKGRPTSPGCATASSIGGRGDDPCTATSYVTCPWPSTLNFSAPTPSTL
jgi:hypothetical protein